MVNKGSVRFLNRDKFKNCLRLRKQGLSYSEIRKMVPVAKSTLQNWLTFAGLTLTKAHLQIQLKKRLEKRQVAIEASRITRAQNAEKEIHRFTADFREYLNDPFFVGGLMLYEAEGSKSSCRFSNSDYRLILMFVRFMEKYFLLDRRKNMYFRIYVHESRGSDLEKIKGFWSKKLNVSQDKFSLSWKKNIVTHRRTNPEYVGQLAVGVSGVSFLTRKLRYLSGIILMKYCRVV